jgi:hypothetical protein
VCTPLTNAWWIPPPLCAKNGAIYDAEFVRFCMHCVRKNGSNYVTTSFYSPSPTPQTSPRPTSPHSLTPPFPSLPLLAPHFLKLSYGHYGGRIVVALYTNREGHGVVLGNVHVLHSLLVLNHSDVYFDPCLPQ